MRSLVIATLAVTLVACSGGSKRTETPPLTVGAGGCCGDPTHCRTNLCADSLHCGASQTPTAVYVCCANGSFCCATDSDCQDHVPGGACNTATSTCYTSCATDDDTRCAAGYHCETSTCVADLTSGTCDEASDCASGTCSTSFDPKATTSICAAAAGECASGNQSWPVGYSLCSGNAFFRRCDAEGQWSAQTPNPHPANVLCDAGGGAASGFEPALACTSGGVDTVAPSFPSTSTCQSCFPYRATGSGCLDDATGCANDTAHCWADHYCSPQNKCEPKLANGVSCAKGSDCTSGVCNQKCAPCLGDSDCEVGYFCEDNSHACVPTLGNSSPCNRPAMCQINFCYQNVCEFVPDGGDCSSDWECQSGYCSLRYLHCE